MEKSATQKVRLGVFVIIGLLLFVLAIYFIGEKQKMFGETRQLSAIFNNVSGLQLGNNVRYSGINVGTVREIIMINDTTIRVDMIIDKEVFKHIKKNAVATIGSDGLVGNMIINIVPGKKSDQVVQSKDIILSVNKIRTDDILNTLNITNKNAALLTVDLLKITKEIKDGKGTVGLLINDTVMGSDLKKTMQNLKLTSEGTTESVTKLNSMIAELNNNNSVIGVLKDTAVANKIKTIVGNLNRSSNEINKVVTNLNATILNVKDGKGVINYLSNDPKLVSKIDSTMTNVKAASFRLNENLEALKHNFFFRGYFKKQEKAKLKAQKK